jgi:hypothetical protein
MSSDSDQRVTPPDFGDDDTKDDDQMFKSARLPATDDVPLSGEDDDDDDNPFGEPAVQNKTPKAVVESPINYEAPLTIPPVTPIAIPEPQPPSPAKQETKLFPTDTGINSTETNTSITQPIHSAVPFESQISSLTTVPKSIVNEPTGATTNVKSERKRSIEQNTEITVSDPAKVGDVCRFIFNANFKFILVFILGYVIIYDISYNNKNLITNV